MKSIYDSFPKSIPYFSNIPVSFISVSDMYMLAWNVSQSTDKFILKRILLRLQPLHGQHLFIHHCPTKSSYSSPVHTFQYLSRQPYKLVTLNSSNDRCILHPQSILFLWRVILEWHPSCIYPTGMVRSLSSPIKLYV